MSANEMTAKVRELKELKAMPELYGQFTKTSESRRFSIA